MINLEKETDIYLKRLFPITRSITGNSNINALKILQELTPLDILEYPVDQKVYDLTIPQEWNIKDAWIKNSKSKKNPPCYAHLPPMKNDSLSGIITTAFIACKNNKNIIKDIKKRISVSWGVAV
jgi:aminopeptidase-like protein